MSEHPRLLVVGNVSDDPFALDIAYLTGQNQDVADVISLKTFANSEFCPRFLLADPRLQEGVGRSLEGRTVVICSAGSQPLLTRNALCMMTLTVARAARENGAERVVLVEPDLFFSAQDRGPRRREGEEGRTPEDLKKFDGQPCTAALYAELLAVAGVTSVVTVHNHSAGVQRIFTRTFGAGFHNLLPHRIYAEYLRSSDMVVPGPDGGNLVVCAPDEGAAEFAGLVRDALGLPRCRMVRMAKERRGERHVEVRVADDSECGISDLEGKDVIVVDDMVRTGRTIVETCEVLRQGRPRRVSFVVTHFHPSPEVRDTLNAPALDEILTLNTIPSILNRDCQGRLRRKMTVLKIERWIAHHLLGTFGLDASRVRPPLYAVDMSSKNPRWRPPAA